MNGFRKLQQRLREEGWYVGWNLPCCQTCAWAEIPMNLDTVYGEDGYVVSESDEEVDLNKVLFNHSQDCEVDLDCGEDCPTCCGEGCLLEEDDDVTCPACGGSGSHVEGLNLEHFDTSVSGFICNTPEEQDGSYFCFSGDKTGVANLKAILPIIEECGCKIQWDGTGKNRPLITWELK